MAASRKSKSSMRVQQGSAQGSSSSHISPRAAANIFELESPIDRYLGQDRDYRSYVSASYDPHQNAAKINHDIQLMDVINRVKGLGC
jgi:hypothetical protein